MAETKQKQIDEQMLALLDSLRKSGALNVGESNWYNARRGAIGGLQAEAAGEDGATTVAARALSRMERKTIEKILSSHGVMPAGSQA